MDKFSKFEKVKNKEKFKPSKLKENLMLIKEESDGYYYKPTYKLVCHKQCKFKVMIYGDIKKSLIGGVYFVSNDDGLEIRCQCIDGRDKIDLFNSRIDGYDGYVCGDNEKNFSNYKEFRCVKCNENDFGVEVTYEYANDKEQVREIQETLKELKKDDFGNTYFWILITLKCNNCGRVYKKILSYECA